MAKYARVLDTGNASVLMTLSPRNKHHAMSALANLAKYTGRYDFAAADKTALQSEMVIRK